MVSVQPFSVAVTTIFPVIAPVVGFAAVKLGTFPDPLAPRPMDVFELVHVNVARVGVVTKLVAVVLKLSQIV
jgi:hypothetical protein